MNLSHQALVSSCGARCGVHVCSACLKMMFGGSASAYSLQILPAKRSDPTVG